MREPPSLVSRRGGTPLSRPSLSVHAVCLICIKAAKSERPQSLLESMEFSHDFVSLTIDINTRGSLLSFSVIIQTSRKHNSQASVFPSSVRNLGIKKEAVSEN